jgi:hypothetical protein
VSNKNSKHADAVREKWPALGGSLSKIAIIRDSSLCNKQIRTLVLQYGPTVKRVRHPIGRQIKTKSPNPLPATHLARPGSRTYAAVVRSPRVASPMDRRGPRPLDNQASKFSFGTPGIHPGRSSSGPGRSASMPLGSRFPSDARLQFPGGAHGHGAPRPEAPVFGSAGRAVVPQPAGVFPNFT